MERTRFRLAPQISLEILLLLGAGRGAVPLTRIYEDIAAAEKSVRSHVRALTAAGLVAEEQASGDKRTKRLRLTHRGQADLAAYVSACDRLFPAPDAPLTSVHETFLP